MENVNVRELFIREENARKQIISPLLSGLGLTPGQGQARILYNLLKKDHVTQKELADRCKVEAATMSRNIDKLVEMGYLVRGNNPECRRSVLVSLTEKGVLEAVEVKKVFQQFEDIACKEIENEEMEVFNKVLVKICENLENHAS